MRVLLKRGIAVSLLMILILTIYTIWDNNRVTVAEQEIFIENLPEGLEGYTILQVTDLHEKVFGKNQEKLINIINSIHYDTIVLTGDMMESPQSTNYQPYYSLIEGIQNKQNALFVPGNADPAVYKLRNHHYEKNNYIIGMEKRGVKLLESIHTVKKNDSIIHFVNFELSIKKNSRRKENKYSSPYAYENSENVNVEKQKQLMQEIKVVNHTKGIIIALNHYPVPDQRIDYLKKDKQTVFRDYDLLIGGHYHGGQIRLPFFGALYVPEPLFQRKGLFPPQDRVKGLWEHRGIEQYVSTGLGSSNAITFLNFRFFNPPEINVLTLKRKNKNWK
ncbi:metallophosphoesterase [Peribacillus glennii]|uniref:Metallophosphoesterase n=1 Tax=Peribacillus glennii TaxID=2303991 RepID=A0A372LGK5_9BACI|nr:metallophosphoesterase [Peribacillus glennii]RFU64736.1 metallophosphoesterase [Peribacillus glennii]